MTKPATFVRLLGSLGEHLTTFPLPARIASVQVASDVLDGDQVTVHLMPVQLPALATGLLAWIDTLTAITVTAWRPPHGETVHLDVTGQLPNATRVTVYGGVDYTDALFGDLQPGGRHGVALSVLRGWAVGDAAVAA